MPVFRRKIPGFAWETVSEDEAGGGFSVGSSYLALIGDVITGTAMGATSPLTWAEWASADSDITLRAGGHVIDINTDGWYGLTIWAPLAGAFNQTQLVYTAPASNPGSFGVDNTLSLDPALGFCDMTLSVIAAPMSAGDTLTFQAWADNAGSVGTYDVGPQQPGGLITRFS